MSSRRKPRLTKKDRKASRRNARAGLRTWEDMTTEQRIRARSRPGAPSWGFRGKSPRTVNRVRRPARIEDY